MSVQKGKVTANSKWFGVALQALLVLACSNGVCPSANIAQKVQSQATMLRRIFSQLAGAGIVEAREGRDGGYRLKKTASAITLAEIYQALNITSPLTSGMMESVQAYAFLGLSVQEAFAEIAAKTEERMLDSLRQYTLADLMGMTTVSLEALGITLPEENE